MALGRFLRRYGGSPAIMPVLVLLLLAVTFASADGCRADTTVSASLQPAQFPADMGSVLTVTVSGSRSADIRIPAVAGISFQEQGKSSQMQIINGSFSSSIAYSYLVQADTPGAYTLPAISVNADGKTLATTPIPFEVTPAGSPPPSQGNTGQPATRLRDGETDRIAFLRLSPLQPKSWTGEVLPLRIKAYFRQGIRANLNTLPVLKNDGLVMPQLNQKPPQTEETVEATPYSVLTWDTYISPVKEGNHTLTIELDATLLLPQRQRRPMFPGFADPDLFQDDFFQSFFGAFTSKNVKVTSRPVSIEARQLPADNQPRDFSGAIGRFDLSVAAKPTKVEVGDPITLTMTVSGSGNFDRVEAPKFPEDPKWKSYPPAADFRQEGGPSQGKKKFEQAIVVKDSQVTAIPPVSFVFFNPATEKYVRLTSAPIPLTVKQAAQAQAPAAASPPPPAAKTEPEVQGLAGLAPIHPHLGVLQRTIVPLFARGWFVAVMVLCATLLLADLCWWARRRYLHRHPELVRKKEMQELLAGNMLRVTKAAAAGNSQHFLAACRKAIQEVLGHHWRTEPQAITLADLRAKLDPSSSLIAIFAAAEQCAYVDCTLDEAEIRRSTDQLQQELTGLL